ncbi:hypothetical protein RsoM2USA_142 [Ralstonia phage RsoM2USA]|nr:hypothetical protein RsoM2USA_142 [Ralstonia phage RsoM2USA]
MLTIPNVILLAYVLLTNAPHDGAVFLIAAFSTGILCGLNLVTFVTHFAWYSDLKLLCGYYRKELLESDKIPVIKEQLKNIGFTNPGEVDIKGSTLCLVSLIALYAMASEPILTIIAASTFFLNYGILSMHNSAYYLIKAAEKEQRETYRTRPNQC